MDIYVYIKGIYWYLYWYIYIYKRFQQPSISARSYVLYISDISWAPWRPKSSVTCLFVQQLLQVGNKDISKFPMTDPHKWAVTLIFAYVNKATTEIIASGLFY